MRLPTLLLAATGAIALPSVSLAAPTCPAATADIAAQADRFNAAWASLDPDKVTALFTAEPVLLATVSNTPRTTPPAVRDYFVSFLKARPVARFDTTTIERDCQTASRVGTWTVVLTDPASGKVNEVKARYSFLYRFEGGDWKIDHLHSSAMPEAAAKP